LPPSTLDLAEAHRRYTGAINARFHWTGHLFQGRVGAVVMDEPHLLAAARYIALNPVVAGLVSRAEGLAMVERPCPPRGR
jgi:putative transposase